MRVTTAGQTQAIIARLLDTSSKLAEAQDQVTTGLKVSKMSDDPTSASLVVRDSAALRGIDQYTRNATTTGTALAAEDSVTQQLSDLLNRAKELGVGANSSTASASARAASAAEVQQLLDQAVSLGNTKVGNTYLFGGTNNDGREPFDATQSNFVPTDPSTTPGGAPVPRYPQGQLSVDVGAGGQTVTGAHDGTTLFLDTTNGAPNSSKGVLPALQQLQQALAGSNTSAIAGALTAIDTASDTLQVHVGELGARQDQVDAVKTGLTALQTTLTQQKSDLSEVDTAQAYTEMVARQTAYQTAMLASSKVMGLSLTDYLK
ncbi:flagellar hook-associated protein 3 [Gemmatimonadetes bacterium T265]|nr:flagellar hook-associated protein 3 [Gemmatimonadetes bacterium T265]